MSCVGDEISIFDQQSDKKISYEDALSYWTDIPPTVDGMLGGFGFISSIDIKGSDQFLKGLFQLKNPPGACRALDCGAGIGRITKHLLVNHFKKIDLVEPTKSFIDESRSYIQNDDKLGNLFNVGLQEFKPSIQYDVIWCQWVLSHLTNQDLVQFFLTCRQSLTPNGVIVVKENLSSRDEGDVDETDSSRTRHEKEMKQIFSAGRLKILRESVQKGFPKGLFKVKMYALRPFESNAVGT